MFIPYIVFCEKCGSYYELEEDESVLDFTDSKCSCGGSLKFARSMEEMDETLSKLSSSNNGNLLTRYWNGLNTKRKIKIISGLFLILLAIIIISTGILSPKVTQVTSTPQSGEFPRMLSNANVSGIEVRIITNSSWQGISSILLSKWIRN